MKKNKQIVIVAAITLLMLLAVASIVNIVVTDGELNKARQEDSQSSSNSSLNTPSEKPDYGKLIGYKISTINKQSPCTMSVTSLHENDNLYKNYPKNQLL